jgi:signal transduction histidine kinase
VSFRIAPTWYQSIWFRLASAAALLLLLGGLYRYRLHQIALEFNTRLDERVNERTRIARELHDTLLQSFHGLLFRFQAARNMLPRRPDEAIQALDGALIKAEQAIAEGRNAIQDLRSEPSGHTDLEQLLTATGQELEGSQDAKYPASFSLTVEGKRQAVSPILQDEVYRIGRELLRNAFRHAHAKHIEARSDTTTPNFGCVSGTMEKAWTRTSSRKAGAPDTGGCPASMNVRNESEHAWTCGATPERVQRSS